LARNDKASPTLFGSKYSMIVALFGLMSRKLEFLLAQVADHAQPRGRAS
jgi:hypothetical protein